MDLIAPEIESLTSINLENYVAGLFQFGGYYVNQDLTFVEEQASDPVRSVNLFQLDIIAVNFHPFGEDRLVAEVKGGGTFTDFFKFLGIKTYLKPDQAYLITNNSNHFDDLYKAGKSTGVYVLKAADVFDAFSQESNKEILDFWYWSNELGYLLTSRENLLRIAGGSFTDEQNGAYQEIRRYLSQVKNRIWKTLDPIEQSIELKELMDNNRGFVRSILRIQKLEATDTENAISSNFLCESASYVVLLTKVYYIVSAVRCAIYSVMIPGNDYIDSIQDSVFKSVVEELKSNINFACRLPEFLQFWIFLCGGMFDSENEELEYFSKVLGIREEAFLKYIELIKSIFTLLMPQLSIQWSLNERDTILEFNHLPNSLRGIGIKFREYLNIDTSNYIYSQMFTNRLDEF